MVLMDIILGIMLFLCCIGFIFGIWLFFDSEWEAGFSVLCISFIGALIFSAPILVLDKGSGATMGEITSVDKNFYGTTALYVKTSETEQEKYCIEDVTLAAQAPDYIGKKVKITYGERVGLYSVTKCSQAPVETIELVEE